MTCCKVRPSRFQNQHEREEASHLVNGLNPITLKGLKKKLDGYPNAIGRLYIIQGFQ